MKVLLVNLARMGDLVQTTPAAIGLKQEPGVRISLLVTSNLGAFARQLEGIDEVLTFDEAKLLPDILKDKGSLTLAGKAWGDWIASLRARKFDRVINLTHDTFSSHLVSQLMADDLVGRQRVGNGELVVHGDWMHYFFTLFHFRSSNPFNLADVYRMACGSKVGAIPVQMKAGELRAELLDRLNRETRPIVALHPGANHPLRQWPVTSYAELSRLLQKAGATVLLLGSPAEAELSAEIALAAGGLPLNLAGLTSIEDLPTLLANVDLLVTNDTGPLHIAAAVGTPTVSIFLAMARPQDTAPCAPGHMILETLADTHPCPETHPCLSCSCGLSVPIEAAGRAALYQLGLVDTPELDESTSSGIYRLLETAFAEDGCLDVIERQRVGSDRDLSQPASLLRSFWMALVSDVPFTEFDLEAALQVFSPREIHSLARAVDLAEAILDRLYGRPSQSAERQERTLHQLETQWLQLEQQAGLAAAPMLLFRLEREELYGLGIERLREVADQRFSRWMNIVKQIAGLVADGEVVR